jgi:hypothetical protein
MHILLFVRWLQDLEAAHERLIDAHHGARVVEFAAVVRRRKERNQLPLAEKLVAILDYLMGSADQINVVAVRELGYDIFSKGEGNATVVLAPIVDVLVGVRPKEVAQEASVGDVGGPHDVLNRVDFVELRGEPAVHAENLVVDDGGDGEAIEAVREHFPQLDGVAALALVVEAVDAIDAGALVVAAQQEEVLRVLYLVGQQKAHGLQALLATVNVVAQEQVVRVWGEPAILKQTQQVVVLAMYVA